MSTRYDRLNFQHYRSSSADLLLQAQRSLVILAYQLTGQFAHQVSSSCIFYPLIVSLLLKRVLGSTLSGNHCTSNQVAVCPPGTTFTNNVCVASERPTCPQGKLTKY